MKTNGILKQYKIKKCIYDKMNKWVNAATTSNHGDSIPGEIPEYTIENFGDEFKLETGLLCFNDVKYLFNHFIL